MSHQSESQSISGGRKGKEKKLRKSSTRTSSFSLTSPAPGSLPVVEDAPTVLPYRRKKPTFTKEVTEFLKSWIIEHADYPYPNEKEKKQLSEITGLSGVQITNWMVNARRRIPSLSQPKVASTSLPAAQSGLCGDISPSSLWSNQQTTESMAHAHSTTGVYLRPILPMFYPAPTHNYRSELYPRGQLQLGGTSPNISQLNTYSSSSDFKPATEWIHGSRRNYTEDNLYAPTQAMSRQQQTYSQQYIPQNSPFVWDRTQQISQTEVYNAQQYYYSDDRKQQVSRYLQPNEPDPNASPPAHYEHRYSQHG
ncbi:hypothetical protein CVT25_003651 [Psilocybe cyanescens]|uniref:Homeobox domain-containing protein n=1 Tax=Psilocybe cyanescens TaxID=93625 RepID=A0A409WPD3_PSICY|nr:hypothetical protein CVT25_003651 [Psilocybe cyanescens]